MYDGNPLEINVGSSKREVRVSEGLSYRKLTVFTQKFNNAFLCLFLRNVKETIRLYFPAKLSTAN